MECSLSVEFHVVRYLLRCRIKVLKKASIKKKSSAKRRHMGALDLHAIFARYRVHPSFSPLWPCHFLIKILLTIEVSQVSHLILILVICIQSWNIYIYLNRLSFFKCDDGNAISPIHISYCSYFTRNTTMI